MIDFNSLRIFDAGGDGDCLFRSILAFYTHDRKIIDRLHFPLRIKIYNHAQSHLSKFRDVRCTSAELEQMKKRGAWGENSDAIIAADLLQRNIVIIHSNYNEQGFEFYTPQSNDNYQLHNAFNKHPIILYGTPDHYQSVISGNKSVDTSVILKDLAKVIKQKYLSTHPHLIQPISNHNFENIDELNHDKMKILDALKSFKSQNTNSNTALNILLLSLKILFFPLTIIYYLAKFSFNTSKRTYYYLHNKFPFNLNNLFRNGFMIAQHINSEPGFTDNHPRQQNLAIDDNDLQTAIAASVRDCISPIHDRTKNQETSPATNNATFYTPITSSDLKPD